MRVNEMWISMSERLDVPRSHAANLRGRNCARNSMRNARLNLLLMTAVATFAARAVHGQGFTPAEAAGRMSVADGLEVRLVAAEPLLTPAGRHRV